MIIFRLKEIAEQKEFNRHQISMLTGVSYPTISKYWDNKADSFDKSILDKLCYLLNVTPGDLIEFTPVTIHGSVAATLDDVTDGHTL